MCVCVCIFMKRNTGSIIETNYGGGRKQYRRNGGDGDTSCIPFYIFFNFEPYKYFMYSNNKVKF